MKTTKIDLSETLKQEFKKDLELFQYFLVLLNSSSPIRNVELMWAEDLELFDPTGRLRMSTGDALVELKLGAEGQGRTSPSPSTQFCDLVHGFSAYEEQTCARSDKPARDLCRATCRSQVYPCHVGLTDIAVPVICEGRYLGTLFSGQVLSQPPTAEGFAAVRNALDGQPHIDLARLEEAWYRVPVVTTAQLAEMVRMLEVFARYLANAWKRLEIISNFQQMREREMALDRRQLAELLLAGGPATSPESLRELARNVGLERLPDRVMILRLQPAMAQSPDRPHIEDDLPSTDIAAHLTRVRVSHQIEDRAHAWANTLAVSITPGEICIFTALHARTPGHKRMLLEEIAQTLLRLASTQGMPLARVGISALHTQPAELLRAFHEAASALDRGHSTLNWFEAATERHEPLRGLAGILKCLQATESNETAPAVREFLASAAPASASIAELQQSRGLLTWACEHLACELAGTGPSALAINAARDHAVQLIVGSPSSFAMAEAFRDYVSQLRQQVMQMFSQREEKIVQETQRLVREMGPQKVTIHDLARDLKISPGHLGRVYRRTTGHTLEEYLIRQRLEMSKRLLLDPRLQVAEVADRCGFCNPAYFASVFKKYMHCTPRAFASHPQRWSSAGQAAN